jgi:predicted membrane protein
MDVLRLRAKAIATILIMVLYCGCFSKFSSVIITPHMAHAMLIEAIVSLVYSGVRRKRKKRKQNICQGQWGLRDN